MKKTKTLTKEDFDNWPKDEHAFDLPENPIESKLWHEGMVPQTIELTVKEMETVMKALGVEFCPNCDTQLTAKECKARCLNCGYFDDCGRGPT